MGTKSTTSKAHRPNGKADGNRQRGQHTAHSVAMDVCFGTEPAIAGFLEGFGERLFNRFYREADAADPAAQMEHFRRTAAETGCRVASVR